jgi:ubiquinone/menaquinone biosynthesis C-methylase UbiE
MAAGGLFEGAADDYTRFRELYPDQFIDLVAQCCRVDRSARVLDLGCGPGFLAIPLALRAREVVGVDPEAEMLTTADRLAKKGEIFNLRWVKARSNELGPELGRFRLVTIGRAFHWMDRAATLRALHAIVAPGGAVAIIDQERDRDPRSWRRVVRDLSDRRGDTRADHAFNPSHDQIVAESAFQGPEYLRWPASQVWTVEEFLGYLRSTSTGVLRQRAGTTDAFEAELKPLLLEIEPTGRYVEQSRFRAMIGWKY